MKARVAAFSVLLAAAVAGGFFAPVFGFWALFPPLLAVFVAGCLVVEACLRLPALAPWRPALMAGLGLLGIVETTLRATTVGGLPTGETVRAIAAGITQSWQLALQSTWPARPDPELLLFVPLAVLAAAVIGLELLRWAPAALLPSLLVVGLSQAYVPLTSWTAAAAGFAYALVAGAVLAASRRSAAGVPPARRRAPLWAPAVVLGVAGVVVITLVDPVTPAVTLRQQQAVTGLSAVASPLDGLAAALRSPEEPVFTYTANAGVDRWRMGVLAGFNGATWSSTSAFRRMGSAVSVPAAITVPTVRRVASVSMPPGSEPWLPSQPLPAMVGGAAPLLDQESGVLVVPERAGPLRYSLSWAEPVVDPARLAGAPIDSRAAGGFAGLGSIPPGISELATAAVAGMRPSFQTALVLERYLSTHYKVATGTNLPTGAGWPQLTSFLLRGKRGTSEQFAAAYVVLARILGIPARLAVGYRGQRIGGGEVTVRNRDVLAWPEVAVAGVGWVPLDPTRKATGSAAIDTGLAAAAAQARATLPPAGALKDPPLPDPPARSVQASFSLGGFVVPALIVILGLVLLVLLAIPLAGLVRTWRRRRAVGTAAVIAAWAEARDLLRAHGVPVTRGMTVRDAAEASAALTGAAVEEPLRVLAVLMDAALWSGAPPQPGAAEAAWAAVHLLRRALARRPILSRVRAAVTPVRLVRFASG